MKITKIKTETYNVQKDWYVDIVTVNDYYEAWLYHLTIGTKSLMFGIPQEQTTYEEFLQIVENNVPDYADDYMYDFVGR